MKLPARIVACLLPFMLSACFHKTSRPQVQTVAPPLKETTPPKPTPTPAELPASALTIPAPPPPEVVTAPPQEIPKPRPKHHKTVSKPILQATSGAPGVSAIGQLSSGEPSDLRRQTEDSIATTDRGLNGIGRRLNDQEQKTAAQIREFLKQARLALASGDVDGAHTLAVKAKVLLGELSR
jgi:type IV secretory pathway VirB10-like protein